MAISFSLQNLSSQTIATSTLTASGIVRFSSNADASDATGTTGALGVLGGISVVGKSYFGADAIINGVSVGRGGGSVIRNVAVGTTCLPNNTTGSRITAVGYLALQGNISGSNLTAIGASSMPISQTGDYNTAIGGNTLGLLTTASNVTALGYMAGASTNASGGLFLGAYSGKYSTASDHFFVNNQDRLNEAGDQTKSLLYGTFAADPAQQTLRVNGSLTSLGAFRSESTTEATDASGTTGALGMLGGLSVAKKAYFGDKINVKGAIIDIITPTDVPSIEEFRNIVIGGLGSCLQSNTIGKSCISIGYNANRSNTTGQSNIAIGKYVLDQNTTGNDNIGLGYLTLAWATTAGENVAIGGLSMWQTETGNYNTAIGTGTMGRARYCGDRNVAIGSFAGYYAESSDELYIGNRQYQTNAQEKAGHLVYGKFDASPANQFFTVNGTLTSSLTTDATTADGTTGALRTLGGLSVAMSGRFGRDLVVGGITVGRGGSYLTNNQFNVAFGYDALKSDGGTTGNVAIGASSLAANTNGTQNVAIGREALFSKQSGSTNCAIGFESLYSLTGGGGNVALGGYSLFANQTGSFNIGIGYMAGKYETGSNAFYVNNQDRTNTEGDKTKSLLYGTFDADPALQTLTVNGVLSSPYDFKTGEIYIGKGTLSGAGNLVVGNGLMGTGNGYSNTAIGYEAMNHVTSGTSNVGVGRYSLNAVVGGDSNVAVGTLSLYRVVGGVANTSIGHQSMQWLVSGNFNTAIGYGALGAALGSGNVAIGFNAGLYETGSNAFYVNNQDRTNTAGDKAGSLLYGTFNATPANQTLTINAQVGFNCTPAIAKPTVTGSRGSNAALASLITALANYGLITDSTS